MRTKKRTPDFGAISRRSIKRDFQRVQTYPEEQKAPQIEELPKINAERRIIHISETSAYASLPGTLSGNWYASKKRRIWAAIHGIANLYTTTTAKP